MAHLIQDAKAFLVSNYIVSLSCPPPKNHRTKTLNAALSSIGDGEVATPVQLSVGDWKRDKLCVTTGNRFQENLLRHTTLHFNRQ